MKFTKNCPKCQKDMKYSSLGNLNLSIKNNTSCRRCKAEEKRKLKFTKNCHQCGEMQEYSTRRALRVAIKNNSTCNDCRVKNSIKPEEYKRLKRKKYKRIQNKEYRKRPEVILRIKEYNKQLREKPDFLIKQREYDRKRRDNPTFKMNDRMSSGIRKSLKLNNSSKNGRHWENIVGYTVQELKDHLESLFLPGMTWDNYKDWEIDHILPRSFFKFSSTDDVEFRMCWRLENLQPLWAKDNWSKKDKIMLWGKEVRARDIK